MRKKTPYMQSMSKIISIFLSNHLNNSLPSPTLLGDFQSQLSQHANQSPHSPLQLCPHRSRAILPGSCPRPGNLNANTYDERGVLPVPLTPFAGVFTIQGALIDDGPVNTGFMGLGGPAVVQNNTAGTTYQAVLPTTNFNDATGSTITGSIRAQVPQNGTGVMMTELHWIPGSGYVWTFW